MTTLGKIIAGLILLLLSNSIFSQSFNSRLVDENTKQPIPYATIQFGKNKGVISNEEGVFSFSLNNVPTEQDSVIISSMGFERKAFVLKQSLDTLIALAPKAFELNRVFLSSDPLEADEIVEKVKENLDDNYKVLVTKKKIFFRQTDLNEMNKVDFGFQKSTIAELDKQLVDSIASLVPRSSSYYREVVGDFYGDYSKHKFHVDKAAELYDKSKDVSVDGVSDKMERIFKENIKPDSYLKIKSGIFSTKVQLDSIKVENKEESDAMVKVEDRADQKFQQEIKNRISELYTELFFHDDSKLDILRKSNRYNYQIKDYTYIDDQPVYALEFSPKGKKDFKGMMYVNMDDFAILRLEFDNVRPIQKFGLLGITYRHKVFKGRMLFQKNGEGTYSPQYLELNSGIYFGLDRPLKVIEKNKHVKGRRKQNELSLALDIRLTTFNKYEMVVFDSETISDQEYEIAKENENVEATHLTQYDPNFWKGYTIMEPNAAIQSFKVVE
ncbi:MAG: carboxypeptidase-like regulatory domain-containing protein [Flavobacteriaceae bacterium]|nr:MAG: carboxypeptidase-like regulatory domain-containing protein [Flavobacteriaceae bacterium]